LTVATWDITPVSASTTYEVLNLNFGVDGVLGGDVLAITSGANSGYYVISGLSPDGFSVFVTTEFPVVAAVAIDFTIYRPYRNPVSAPTGLGENFLSRKMLGRSIQLDYEWSSQALEIHEYVVANLTRSINQDHAVRHGIPVYVNVSMVVNSAVADAEVIKESVRDYVRLLNQQPLRPSQLIRIPDVARHIPIPVEILGLVHMENRRFNVYRDDDGIEPRRVEILLPQNIEVVVNT
jgi:hypothetical protein